MTPTEEQIKHSLDLGIEYLSHLSRRIRRPSGVLQLPPQTDLAVSHDSPGVPLTRVIPRNNGEIKAGPETISITGVALPLLKMRGDPESDFENLIIGVPGFGTVTNIISNGPNLNGDTWTFEQVGDYAYRLGPDPVGPPAYPLGDNSAWSVKHKSTWSASGDSPPGYQIYVKKISGPRSDVDYLPGLAPPDEGVLVWDNFAVVPETTDQYTLVVDQSGESPGYRSPTSFHTTRYHKNLWMANRHLALHSGNARMWEQFPYLNNFWRQFSNVPGQEAEEIDCRIINMDLYDGLWGWGGDRRNPSPAPLSNPPWLTDADTFYDPFLYSKLFPNDVARAAYRSHAAGTLPNLGNL